MNRLFCCRSRNCFCTIKMKHYTEQNKKYYLKVFSNILIFYNCFLMSYPIQRHYFVLYTIINLTLPSFPFFFQTWRQLWRVLEMSDVVLLIVDIRHPVGDLESQRSICLVGQTTRWRHSQHPSEHLKLFYQYIYMKYFKICHVCSW